MEKFCLGKIYSRLGDEESRSLFEKRLCYSLTGDIQKMIDAILSESVIYKKLLKKNVFKFGAGSNAAATLKLFPKISWKGFIENDKSKVGKPSILPIISFEEFMANSGNAAVFISSPFYASEMKLQLINSGFPEEFIVSINQYFDLPQFKPGKKEFFIDAGGCDGDSTKGFFQWLQDNDCDGGRSIIFEPNPIQYNVCKDNLQNCDNTNVVNKGLWNKKETVKFCNCGLGSRIVPDGVEIVETISLDEYLKDEKQPVTFIKMDVEGAELNALKGAERIIKEHKPKLAICIYHKPEDVWEIPSLLLDFIPDYKFYIRHYSFNHSSDTILYALLGN